MSKDRQQDMNFGSNNQKSRERLRELILFIAERCQGEAHFGAVKLNKILFYSDFISFAKFGTPITGTPYKKLQQGPVPTAVKAVREEMVADGDIAIAKDGFPHPQHRVVPRREANLDGFMGRDIAVVDSVIRWLSDYNATEVSDLSHDRAYGIAEYRETIPYEVALLSDAEPNERDIARAHELNNEFEWDV